MTGLLRAASRVARATVVCGVCFAMLNNGFAESDRTIQPIVASQVDLGVKLLKERAEESNTVVSPYSIHAGLMLARLGAVGVAAQALDEALGTRGSDVNACADAERSLASRVLAGGEKVSISSANSIWITDKGEFKKEFLTLTSTALGAEARRVSFSDPERARGLVNSWVAERTSDKIKTLLPEGTFTTESISALVNTLYFKAPWQSAFSIDSTAPDTFTSRPGVTKQVPMMWSMARHRYYEDNAWQATSLPFVDGAYQFLILVPKEQASHERVRELVSSDLIARVGASETSALVSLRMPRFTLRQSRELSKSLSSLGLAVLFSPQAKFPGITDLDLRISAVQHEAYVAVDENGAEASAATAVTFAKSSAPVGQEEQKEITANHPFVFVITHQSTRAPLFIGIVGDPS